MVAGEKRAVKRSVKDLHPSEEACTTAKSKGASSSRDSPPRRFDFKTSKGGRGANSCSFIRNGEAKAIYVCIGECSRPRDVYILFVVLLVCSSGSSAYTYAVSKNDVSSRVPRSQ